MQNMYGQLLSSGGKNAMYDTMAEGGRINQQNDNQAMRLALGAGGNPADVYAAQRSNAEVNNLQNMQYNNGVNQQAVQNQLNAAQGMQQLPSYMLQPTSLENAFIQNAQVPVQMQNTQAQNQAGQFNAGAQNQTNQFNIQNQMDYQNLLAQMKMNQANQQSSMAQNSMYAYEQPSGWSQYVAPLLGMGSQIASSYLLGR